MSEATETPVVPPSVEVEVEAAAGAEALQSSLALELSAVQAQLREKDEAFRRLQADFQNSRRNALRDRDDAVRGAVERLLRSLLPVADNMERALTAAGTASDTQSIVTGVQMIGRQFADALASNGVHPFAAVGQAFDPARHEALAEQPSATVAVGHVMLEYQKGYLLGDRLLRAAQVVVSSGPATQPQPSA